MIAIKTELKNAQKVMSVLISKKIIDSTYILKKDEKYIYFPVLEEIKIPDTKIVKTIFKKKNIKEMSLKKNVENILTKEEMELFKRSFDAIGDIAILEIDETLVKKEKQIAKFLLDTHINIKTVLKKSGGHEGEFRVQKMKFLAGEDKRETIHKESGVLLKLNVETVYFSPRLANERLRITKLVKPNEEVLVMFSGCAPYPCVLSRLTKAKMIYGIELNPEGHNYGWENVKLNKLTNVFLINDDVKKAVPHFYQKILGMKFCTKPEEMKPRLKYNPTITEIHTTKQDFCDGFDELKKTIKYLKDLGKFVVVHQPMLHLDEVCMTVNDSSNEYYKKMISLVEEFDVYLVIHLGRAESTDSAVRKAQTFSKYYNNIFFENTHRRPLAEKENLIKIIKNSGIKRICIDTCHLMYVYSGDELVKSVAELQKHADSYFHLSDFKNDIHAGKLDKNSVIDLEKILPLVTKGVVEIKSKDEKSGDEMISSWKYLDKFQKKFDRILMPLPKSAEDFLDAALAVAKKGTVIHFYDFLREEDIPKVSVNKIDAACKRNKMRYKILNCVKCGQHAPRTFRVCVDFEII